MSFKVIREITVDGDEFQLVEHTEYQMQAIRQRYDNSAGQTARTCPTVWVEKLPAFIKASTMLLIEENRHLENSLKTKV